jgi:GT2 family glycosyltransferase
MPAHNQTEFTKKAIDSLYKFTHPEDFELILIDNGSTPSLVIPAKAGIQVIRNESNSGWCRALNQGFKAISPDSNFVLWANNDILFEKDWLPKMLAHFRPGIGAVGPTSNYVFGRQRACFNNHVPEEEVNWLIGFFLMFRRGVIDAIGEVDERFSPGGSEEWDYIIRMQQNFGLKCLIARDVYIHHFGSRTIRSILAKTPEEYNDYSRKMHKILKDKWGADFIDQWVDQKLSIAKSAFPNSDSNPWPADCRLAWAMPHSLSIISTATHYSLMALKRPPVIEYLTVPRGGDIAGVRELQAAEALDKGFTHVWFFDGDMVFPPSTLSDLFGLLAQGAELAGGLCYRGYPPFDPIAWHPAEKRMLLPMKDFKFGDIIEAKATGCACLLIKIEVLKKLKRPWFRVSRKGERVTEGEDFYFTSRATAAGFKLLINTGYDIDHIREFPVNREIFLMSQLFTRILGAERNWDRVTSLWKKLNDDPDWLDRVLGHSVTKSI